MALTRSIGARKDATRGTTPLEVRKDLAGLVTGAGVLPGGSSPLVTGSAGWQYTVKAAKWVTSRGASDGVHLWGNDGDILVGSSGVGGTVTAAPGAGLSRIDIIYALHPSNGENSDTTSAPTVAVAVGTPGSPGLAPIIPTGALELARNTMTSTATTTASSGNTITQSAVEANLVEPTPAAWVNATPASPGGFTTFGDPLALRLTHDGMVEVRGARVYRTSTTLPFTAGVATTIWAAGSIPAGHRPSGVAHQPGLIRYTAAPAVCEVQITSAGAVIIVPTGSGTMPVGTDGGITIPYFRYPAA